VWSDAWKYGREAIEISPRLCVRPPFAPAPANFSGAEIVIEPAQAFGTGHHASTRLALESLDAARDQVKDARVLDVGCGSGVLALAALMLGAGSVVAHDLDPLSGSAAGEAVAAHRMWGRALVFTGTTEAITPRASAGFDGIVANMIRSQLDPLLGDFATLTRPGGWFVASGLLVGERERFEASCEAVGFELRDSREARDGDDHWLAIGARRSDS
jgi:ribosomal protein L11 methyltransferase